MGLTVHWDWHGPKSGSEAESIIEKMRQRALDLPFESVSEIVSFKGESVQFDPERRDDEFGWLKVQSRQTVWNKDRTVGWDCVPTEIIGFQIDVAPGSEPMEVIRSSSRQSRPTDVCKTGFHRFKKWQHDDTRRQKPHCSHTRSRHRSNEGGGRASHCN